MVAVGVSDYPGTVNDLRLPVNDVKAILDVYVKKGGVSYELITDNKARVSTIKKSMNRVYAKAKSKDIVLFVFSGHGYQGGFHAYDGRLTYDDVRQAMARSHSKHKMIFADACYSGKIAGNKRGDENNGKSDVMLFLSSRANEKSLEKRTMKNGMFTAALIKGLRGAADTNRDRTITAKELFQYVSPEVKRMSRDRQHPVMWGNFKDNMPVISW